MQPYRTTTYPNGLTKSYLCEVYLVAADFGSEQSEFNFDLALMKQEEATEVPNCAWHIDSDDRIVVDEVALENTRARVIVTGNGFRISSLAVPGNQIFVNYAREDERVANTVANSIKRVGYATWLDKESLFAGQTWKLSINEAIDQSDLFVALLSRNSVSKTGYVNAELRRALDRMILMPEGEVFVIPVRLDDCSMPFTVMREMQYVDLFPTRKEGINRLLRAIEEALQHNKRSV